MYGLINLLSFLQPVFIGSKLFLSFLFLSIFSGNGNYYQNNTFEYQIQFKPIATQSQDTVWAGEYLTIHTGYDTANTSGTIELFHKKAWFRIRQTGLITKVSFYIFDKSLITNFRFRIWRPVNTVTNSSVVTLVKTSENLAPVLVNGINNISLSVPIPAVEGDMYSLYYESSGNGIACVYNTNGLADSCRSYSSYQSDTLSKNWGLGTPNSRYFPIRFYMQPPTLILIGNSIIDGAGNSTPAYCSGASHLSYFTYDVRSTIAYRIGDYANFTYQNMGISSQGIASHILPRFSNDVIAQKPEIVILEGGTNDIASGANANLVTSAAKNMIDAALANSMKIYYFSILPRNTFTNYKCLVADSVNSDLKNYCENHANSFFVDLRPYVGMNRDSGSVQPNLWNIRTDYTADYLHPNVNGSGRIASVFLNEFKNNYIFPDTAQTYISSFTILNDISRNNFPQQLDASAHNFLGIDSVTFSWYRNQGGVTNNKLNFVFGSSTVNGNNYNLSWNPDTSLLAAGDSVFYRYNFYGYTNASTQWGKFRITNSSDYRTGLMYEWYADSNTVVGSNATWKNTMDTLTARQNNSQNQPVYIPNVLNGRGIMRFNQPTSNFFSIPSINLTNFTIIVVYKNNTINSVANMLLGGNNQQVQASLNAFNQGYGVGIYSVASWTVPYSSTDLNWQIRGFQNNKLFTNGIEPVYSAGNIALSGLTLTRIGARQDGYYLDGDISCIRIYNSNLSNSNYNIVNNYINSLYNVYTPLGIINNEIPVTNRLFQNYPNPFNPVTSIKFSIHKSGFAVLKIFDITGREVLLILNKNLNAGTYKIDFDASNFASGVYFYKLETTDYSDVKKLVFIK